MAVRSEVGITAKPEGVDTIVELSRQLGQTRRRDRGSEWARRLAQCSPTATSAAPKPVAGISKWTTDNLLIEAGYWSEGGESQEPGEVPGVPGIGSLWERFEVGKSLTVIAVTLKLRETTMPF